ncbi:MAG: 30S ribosomal protein S11 [Candidatus Parcubacteria bacterium]|nr:30S ribosomal protein S11 [Candidatus Parcubacteria bacterium]
MGKRRVTTQSGDIDENKAVANAGSKGLNRRVEKGSIYINSSFNNTIISATDDKGNILAWSSSGSLGFKGPKKATPYAATKVAATVVEKLVKTGPSQVRVFIKGAGSGREAAVRSLVTNGLDIIAIKDVTPIPHNGPRRPKVRRV